MNVAVTTARGSGAKTGPRAPSVSVVIVSYYTGPLLWRSVASALAQEDTLEVVVVDNGNWDRTREDLALMEAEQPRLRVLQGQGNVGFAAASNLGVAASEGEHVFLLNPDAVLPNGALRTLLTEGERIGHDGHWVIGGRLLNQDGTEQAGARRGPLTPWTALVEMGRLYRFAPRHPYFRRFNNHREPCPGRTVPMPVISGACMLMPRLSYDAIGGMDESYFLHVEDVDFCLRLREAGGQVLYAPAAQIVHFKSSSRCNPVRVERLKAQSLNRYFRRHFSDVYPWGFLTLVAGVVWFGFAMRAAGLALRGLAGAVGLGGRVGAHGAIRAARLSRRSAAR